ncbi:PDZ domain-containing protein [Isoptericola sp. CG 20/1183]|uniref:PDZ domain-containing protein n=1 Tax=Isoptericola halotolerans TaxID=300560 RepID=A0ABX5EE93_9MICO|nr:MULTISPECIES: S16 family serine protease [Isoptericola]MCK0117393.1 PDZ domain-containing protein [Isoptericola sp. S6320L]PRZ06865.1 PDZ domain-containing protein [Isoptericola halotolerans]PRZ07463.1 PDZ domain-containing protein [Isoptericola sp. CG 20/1183]
MSFDRSHHPAELYGHAQAHPLPEDRAVAGTDDADGHDPRIRHRPTSRRSVTLVVSLLVTAVVAAVLLVLPTPYAVRTPGPTEDTLGVQEQGAGQSATEMPLIEISGAETYPASGELRLTTVSVYGGPGGDVLMGDVLWGWSSVERSVQPVELIFPEPVTPEEQQEQGQAQMISSQESATVAALTELGYEVPTTMTVVAAAEGTGAEGVVEPDDVIVSMDGEPLESYPELLAVLDDVTPGDDVVLGVERAGEPVDLTVTTGEGDGRALLGVLIDPVYDFPVDVTIQIEDIGGPSAGTMFALGIVDLMTPEDELAGAVVAGTGTMDVDGRVGPIGGIGQKMYGAQRDGAEWFLAPADNCPEVVGQEPEGLEVVSVSTLAEARAAMEAIGAGEGQDLPRCS